MKGSASPWPGVKCLGRILAAPDRKLAQAPKVPRERTRWLHRDSSARSTPADTEELSLAEPGHRILRVDSGHALDTTSTLTLETVLKYLASLNI